MPKGGRGKKGKAGNQENTMEFDGQETMKVIVGGKVVKQIKVIHKYKLQGLKQSKFIEIVNAILKGDIEVIE